MWPFVGGQHLQVLRFSKRYKAEQRVQEVDTTHKVWADIHKECQNCWEFDGLQDFKWDLNTDSIQAKRWHQDTKMNHRTNTELKKLQLIVFLTVGLYFK